MPTYCLATGAVAHPSPLLPRHSEGLEGVKGMEADRLSIATQPGDNETTKSKSRACPQRLLWDGGQDTVWPLWPMCWRLARERQCGRRERDEFPCSTNESTLPGWVGGAFMQSKTNQAGVKEEFLVFPASHHTHTHAHAHAHEGTTGQEHGFVGQTPPWRCLGAVPRMSGGLEWD